MKKTAPELELLLTAAHGVTQVMTAALQEKSAGFDIPSVQAGILSVLVQNAHRGCVQGKNSRSKETAQRA